MDSRKIPSSAGLPYTAPVGNRLAPKANENYVSPLDVSGQPKSAADKATVQPDGIPGKSPVTSATFNGLDLYANKDQITKASMVATRDFNGKQVPTAFIDAYNKTKENEIANGSSPTVK
jgi:hypothetical protein